MDLNQNVKYKVVVVGDSQCGKTALLHLFAKDSFPERYVPTVFENYTASFEIEGQRIELSLWDTSGSAYYDNVRPLSYPDSDAVLICFDLSRAESLDSVLKKWKPEVMEFCPSTQTFLVGCKSDLRADLSTSGDLSSHGQTPVSYDQGLNMAKQISAPYLECSALQSENSVRDIFHVATLACVSKGQKNGKRPKASSKAAKRTSHLPAQPEQAAIASDLRKSKTRSCCLM